jgi:hypothetical protein
MAYRQGNFAASQLRHSQPDTYPPKTSTHGHYEPKYTYKSGYTEFKWVEAPTPKAAPAAAPKAAPKPVAAPKAPPAPVVHSPEIKQAKERVTKYQDDVLSGKVSEDIYNPQKNSDQPSEDIDGSKQKFAKDTGNLFEKYSFDSSNNMFQV